VFIAIRLAMLGAERRGDERRGGAGCVTGPAIYAKALMMQASMMQTDDAGLDGYRSLDLKGCAEGA
jgi:hypothetical protein